MATAQAEKPISVQARLVGRIVAVRSIAGQAGRTFRTLLKLPAKDEYSSPSTVEVRSTERLGQPEQDIAILVNIGGFPRSFEGKGERGEPGEVVRTAENTLTFYSFA